MKRLFLIIVMIVSTVAKADVIDTTWHKLILSTNLGDNGYTYIGTTTELGIGEYGIGYTFDNDKEYSFTVGATIFQDYKYYDVEDRYRAQGQVNFKTSPRSITSVGHRYEKSDGESFLSRNYISHAQVLNNGHSINLQYRHNKGEWVDIGFGSKHEADVIYSFKYINDTRLKPVIRFTQGIGQERSNMLVLGVMFNLYTNKHVQLY
ncbi:hypothetical protein LP316_13500 [Thalassotalea sp. LPB0316]|uniref:hypothetical protein n=1 Tax=Thalassotalea sp. LPB0316 TaxID=2769490 RepID=UPI001866E583|nr:hypothetical protein [Thalassotalea sp. LPB0316]QOL25298.1 hypothetical protein LP316_13500 [Thalassotalea sp. LPB0316]